MAGLELQGTRLSLDTHGQAGEELLRAGGERAFGGRGVGVTEGEGGRSVHSADLWAWQTRGSRVVWGQMLGLTGLLQRGKAEGPGPRFHPA